MILFVLWELVFLQKAPKCLLYFHWKTQIQNLYIQLSEKYSCNTTYFLFLPLSLSHTHTQTYTHFSTHPSFVLRVCVLSLTLFRKTIHHTKINTGKWKRRIRTETESYTDADTNSDTDADTNSDMNSDTDTVSVHMCIAAFVSPRVSSCLKD